MKKWDMRQADSNPLRRAMDQIGWRVVLSSRLAIDSLSSRITSRIDLPWIAAKRVRASDGDTPRCRTTSATVIPDAALRFMK